MTVMMIKLYDTNNWARRAFEVDPTGFPLRKLFMEAFHQPPAVYFFDGFNAKSLRLAKFPAYKSGRTKAHDNFYVMLGAFKELLMHTGNVIVDVPGYEADDVIATFCKANPDTEIEVLSTDRDFCALHRPGLTTPIANLKGVEACDVRLHKTLVGDTGDNISGIVSFGKKAWEALEIEHKVNWVRQCEGETMSAHQLGLTKHSHIKYLTSNWELLRTFWEIIGFYDVPMDLIGKHTKTGKPDYKRGDEILKEILQ